MLPLLFPAYSSAQTTQSITNPASVLSIFLSLLVVVAIIFALAYVARRFNVAHLGNQHVKVVASMVAGTREKIMVIQVGDEQHLIGVTSHNISHLSKLENNIALQKDAPRGSGKDLFKQKLVAAMAGKINPNTKGDNKDA